MKAKFYLTKDHLWRRRRLRRVGIPNHSPALPLLGRDLHLQIVLGGGGGGGGFRSNSSSSSLGLPTSTLNHPFPGLRQTIFQNLSHPPVTEDVSVNNTIRPHSWKPSYDPCLSSEERERMIKQASSGRASFVQDLLFCTFLEED